MTSNKMVRKEYYKRPSILWWMKSKEGILYMIRELSSLVFMFFAMFCIVVLSVFSISPSCIKHIAKLAMNNVWIFYLTLIFSLIHSFTWFIAMPKALNLQGNSKKINILLLITSCLILLAISIYGSIFIRSLVI